MSRDLDPKKLGQWRRSILRPLEFRGVNRCDARILQRRRQSVRPSSARFGQFWIVAAAYRFLGMANNEDGRLRLRDRDQQEKQDYRTEIFHLVRLFAVSWPEEACSRARSLIFPK